MPAATAGANTAAARNVTDERLRHWAQQTASPGCDAACRLASTVSRWDASWEDTENAASRVCWGCDGHPWSRERLYVRRVWQAIHQEELPIRAVAKRCNLWSVPCPRGVEVRARGARCLVGHFAYAVLCFFRWIGEGNEAYGLLNLESAMDLAWVVQNSSCPDLFGFTPKEVAGNYERVLSSVWHLHEGVPEYWLPTSSGPPACWRPRAPEPQERPSEPPPLGPRRARVQCLVLAVFPGEEDRMSAVVDTYAAHCDGLVFLTASAAPESFRGYLVVDLRAYFGDMMPDPDPELAGGPGVNVDSQDKLNTIQKTLRSFEWAAWLLKGMQNKPDVICRVDSDTMFFPQNLLRIMHCRNFSADVPWALGHENYLHKHQEPGHAFLSGGNGICLSRAAVEVFEARARQGEIRESASPGAWNTGLCVSSPGHWDDVVFGVCLARFGIPLSRWGTDCLGRTLFWPHPLGRALPGPSQIVPQRVPPKVSWFHAPEEESEVRRDPRFASYYHWRYRAWQHFACDPPAWIGDYPVSLHPYRDGPSARDAFAAVVGRRPFDGYSPKLWDGDLDQCYDLLC